MRERRPISWTKRVGRVLAVLVVLVVVMPWTVGMLMEREHTGTGSAVIAAPIDEVWHSVSGFDDLGAWAPDIANLTRVADVNGLPSYETRAEDNVVTFTFVEVSAPERLRVSLSSSDQAYGGEWIYELVAVEGGTRVTITEYGWTEPPFFRFVLRIFGYDRTIQRFLDALAKRHAVTGTGSTAPSSTGDGDDGSGCCANGGRR